MQYELRAGCSGLHRFPRVLGAGQQQRCRLLHSRISLWRPSVNVILAAAISESPPTRRGGSEAPSSSGPGSTSREGAEGGKARRNVGGRPRPTRQGKKTSVQQRVAGRNLTKRQQQRAENDTPQRLAKVIAQAGIASRRKAEELVQSGVVRVNSKQITVPQHMVLPSIDEITVDGKPIPRTAQRYYFALNKPKGFLCANAGAPGRDRQRLVVDLFEAWIEREWRPRHPHKNAVPPRLFTVGRLDVQTTGLLFVTNDGEWAQQVQHPSNNITKEYIVTLATAPTVAQLESIAAGSVVDGAFVQPRAVAFATGDRRDKLRIVVAEGRNREVRTLVENARLEVRSLKRVRIGGFRLPSDLAIGEFRELKSYAIRRVTDRSVELNPQANPTAMF